MIGKRIAQQRALLGLKQKDFAQRIGFSRSYVGSIEAGKTRPSSRFLETVAKEFNISIDALMSESLIVEAIESARNTKDPKLVFLYAFCQSDLDKIEKRISELFLGKQIIFIDGRSCKTENQLLSMMAGGGKGNKSKLRRIIDSKLIDDETFFIIKTISQSGLPKKDAAWIIRDYFKVIDDSWLRNKTTSKSCLILIDFPSFLENNYDLLGYYVSPLFPASEIYEFGFGF